MKRCIALLQENEDTVKNEVVKILLKICNNILTDPQDQRYRKLKLNNSIVTNILLPTAGAIECLFEAGFIENDDEFLLPPNDSLLKVRELLDLLTPLKTTVYVDKNLPHSSKQNSISCTQDRRNSPKEYVKKSFLAEIPLHFKPVIRCEDKDLQAKVKTILPISKFEITAMEKLRHIQKQMKVQKIDSDVVIEDLILCELTSWFKNDFFEWVNSPVCEKCSGECQYEKSIQSSVPYISRIEIHRCKICNSENEFKRYTEPDQLLLTRKGRCGEWGIAFLLLCRTMGYDTRVVYDATDHVWNEVWSVAHNRWIHVDPCENAVDTPLLYEKGWGKKLNYILAYSRDEVQDVTWRYTHHFKQIMKRRNFCSEMDLLDCISKLNKERQSSAGYSKARRKFVTKRRAIELADMLTAPPGCKKPCEELDNSNKYGGRISGSLNWRLARGETSVKIHEKSQWMIPVGTMSFELSYNIVNDKYISKDLTDNKILEQKSFWQSGVEEVTNGIFRKEEKDWKMVYLARGERSSEAKISWGFTVEDDEDVYVKSIQLFAKTKSFNGATVKWEVEGNCLGEKKIIHIPHCNYYETNDLNGAITLNVRAFLSGGGGDNAWQHAQLFRSSLDQDVMEPSLIIRITLSNKASI